REIIAELPLGIGRAEDEIDRAVHEALDRIIDRRRVAPAKDIGELSDLNARRLIKTLSRDRHHKIELVEAIALLEIAERELAEAPTERCREDARERLLEERKCRAPLTK